MQHLLTVIVHYVSVHKTGLLIITIPGGALLSTAIQWFLHKTKIQGDKLSFFISHVFAWATAGSAYVLDPTHPNAAVTWGWLWIASQFWHRLAVNPAYNTYVLPFLDWLAKQNPATAKTPAAAVATPPAATGVGIE